MNGRRSETTLFVDEMEMDGIGGLREERRERPEEVRDSHRTSSFSKTKFLEVACARSSLLPFRFEHSADHA